MGIPRCEDGPTMLAPLRWERIGLRLKFPLNRRRAVTAIHTALQHAG